MRLTGIRHEGTRRSSRRGDATRRLRLLAEVDAVLEDPYRYVDPEYVAPLRAGAPRGRGARAAGASGRPHPLRGPQLRRARGRGPLPRAPEHPTVFGRWTPSLAVSDHEVVVPVDEDGLDWEAELLAVVGRPLSVATRDEAADGGLRLRVLQRHHRPPRAEAHHPVDDRQERRRQRPHVGPGDRRRGGDPATGLRITARVNGELTQDGRTDQMIFRVPELLAFLSRSFTLRPGDLVATGTPSGVGYARTPAWLLHAGDSVEVEIEGIGSVRSHVVGPRRRDSSVTLTAKVG